MHFPNTVPVVMVLWSIIFHDDLTKIENSHSECRIVHEGKESSWFDLIVV